MNKIIIGCGILLGDHECGDFDKETKTKKLLCEECRVLQKSVEDKQK